MDKEKIEELYNGLQSIDTNAIGNVKDEDLLHAGGFESAEQAKAGCQLLVRVAQSSSLEEFQAFATTGEVPAIELSAEELEMMKGGAIGIVAAGLYVLGTIFVAGVVAGATA